jgi:hypothetical protein
MKTSKGYSLPGVHNGRKNLGNNSKQGRATHFLKGTERDKLRYRMKMSEQRALTS